MYPSQRALHSERLTLRGYRSGDLPALVELFGNPAAARHLFGGHPLGEDETKKFIEQEFTFGTQPIGLGSLVDTRSQVVVGFAGILPCGYLAEEDLEFGFALVENAWGKGYATEIGRRQVQYGFEDLRKSRLLALAHPENGASLRVLEKLGMTKKTRIEMQDRGPREVYVMTRTEWDSMSEAGP